MANPLKKFFSSLRGEKKTAAAGISQEIPTIPLPKEPGAPELPPDEETKAPAPGYYQVVCAQSVGMTRDHNEDSLFLLNTVMTNNGEESHFGLFIVADGMGGHKQGEVASGVAVRSLANQIIRKIFLSMIAPRPMTPQDSIQEILESSVQEAHRSIMKEAPGSGTTLTALLLLERHMSIAHVGDSRAYLIPPDGKPQVLTRDHSLVMRMQELGQLTAEEAAVHPQRNVLYKALGQGEPFAPDITSSQVPDGGHLIICSDGLWGVIPEEDLVSIIRNTPDMQTACQMLVDAANDAGGPDNITAILVRLPKS